MSSTSNSIFLTDFTAQNEAEEDQRLAERKQRLVSKRCFRSAEDAKGGGQT